MSAAIDFVGSEFTYGDRDKDDTRTWEKPDVVQALPNGIASPLLGCIQSHLKRPR